MRRGGGGRSGWLLASWTLAEIVCAVVCAVVAARAEIGPRDAVDVRKTHCADATDTTLFSQLVRRAPFDAARIAWATVDDQQAAIATARSR